MSSFLFTFFAFTQPNDNGIQLNQVGFYTLAPKYAVITSEAITNQFYIIDSNLRDTVFTGTLGAKKQSAYSATKIRLADFSSLQTEGKFTLVVPGQGHSYSFNISKNVLKATAIATLKGFYFQRASMPLERKFAGVWQRAAGHPDTSVLIHASASSSLRPTGTVIASPGGWYDAGDYNKYIVNSGISMGTLLSAYEDYPGYFKKLVVGIPESDDVVPDILNEVIYNLRWMLTMQDPGDGGVYHKCTNAVFDGMVMPGVTKAERYVVQKSTAAALDFAAVTAQAARIIKVFEKTYPKLADSCLAASAKAWGWAIKNPSLLYDQNEMNKNYHPEIRTGAYGDISVSDEWLWAACELFATTKEKEYLDMAHKKLSGAVRLPSWNNVAMLGYYTLIRLENKLPGIAATVNTMKDSLFAQANNFISKARDNAFGTVMGQSARDYSWGGNAVAANQGILLLQAYRISGNKDYLAGALSNMDYILGRNATGYSFITGAGTKSPLHPHHRPSEADTIAAPVPGLMVGGPNKGMQDNCRYPLQETENAYLDDVCSYASNEIAINWNAAVVYLSSALEALQNDWIPGKK